MKKTFLVLFLYSLNSFAGYTSKSSNFITEESLENTVKKITDYENTCYKDCKYKISSISEIKIIKEHNYSSNNFYTWTKNKNIFNSKYFSHVSIVNKNNSTFIIQKQVSKEIAKELELKTGLKHKPLLDNLISSYELYKNDEKIHVNYSIEIGYSGFMLNMASNKIETKIDESIEEIKEQISYIQ